MWVHFILDVKAGVVQCDSLHNGRANGLQAIDDGEEEAI